MNAPRGSSGSQWLYMPYMIKDSVTQFYTDKAKPLKINHMINFNLHGEDKKSIIGVILSFV